MKEDKNRLEQRAEELKSTLLQTLKFHDDWQRNLTTISTGLLGLLITLKNEPTQVSLTHVLYSSTVSLIALGILTSLVSLYSTIHVYSRTAKHQAANIIRVLDGGIPESKFLKPGKFFLVVRYVSYVSYILGLITLVTYSILSDTQIYN